MNTDSINNALVNNVLVNRTPMNNVLVNRSSVDNVLVSNALDTWSARNWAAHQEKFSG